MKRLGLFFYTSYFVLVLVKSGRIFTSEDQNQTASSDSQQLMTKSATQDGTTRQIWSSNQYVSKYVSQEYTIDNGSQLAPKLSEERKILNTTINGVDSHVKTTRSLTTPSISEKAILSRSKSSESTVFDTKTQLTVDRISSSTFVAVQNVSSTKGYDRKSIMENSSLTNSALNTLNATSTSSTTSTVTATNLPLLNNASTKGAMNISTSTSVKRSSFSEFTDSIGKHMNRTQSISYTTSVLTTTTSIPTLKANATMEYAKSIANSTDIKAKNVSATTSTFKTTVTTSFPARVENSKDFKTSRVENLVKTSHTSTKINMTSPSSTLQNISSTNLRGVVKSSVVGTALTNNSRNAVHNSSSSSTHPSNISNEHKQTTHSTQIETYINSTEKVHQSEQNRTSILRTTRSTQMTVATYNNMTESVYSPQTEPSGTTISTQTETETNSNSTVTGYNPSRKALSTASLSKHMTTSSKTPMTNYTTRFGNSIIDETTKSTSISEFYPIASSTEPMETVVQSKIQSSSPDPAGIKTTASIDETATTQKSSVVQQNEKRKGKVNPKTVLDNRPTWIIVVFSILGLLLIVIITNGVCLCVKRGRLTEITNQGYSLVDSKDMKYL